jgi:hypothetical protein
MRLGRDRDPDPDPALFESDSHIIMIIFGVGLDLPGFFRFHKVWSYLTYRLAN